jgi:hypothetical protein
MAPEANDQEETKTEQDFFSPRAWNELGRLANHTVEVFEQCGRVYQALGSMASRLARRS